MGEFSEKKSFHTLFSLILITVELIVVYFLAAAASAGTPIGCIFSGVLVSNVKLPVNSIAFNLMFDSNGQMDKIGRKKALLLTEIPLILGWILVSMATDVRMIYIGRLLMGFGSGMVGAPARVYTSEVTQPHLRGMLSALAAVFISCGVLFQYTIGAIASWQVLSTISAIIPTIALITMCLMPETPTYYVAQSKPEKAAKSLSQLRGSRYNIQREVDHLQNFAQKSQLVKLVYFEKKKN